MTVMITLNIPLFPNQSDEMLALLKKALVDTRNYAGCQSIEVFLREDRASLLLIQLWDSKEHQEAYLKWRIDTGLAGLVEPFIPSPLVFKYYGNTPAP